MSQLENNLNRVLQRVTKWRSVFAAWQLGTRTREDPECSAVKDHREVAILLRIEVSALVGCLVKKGVFSLEDFQKQLIEEAETLHEQYKEKFPGMEATEAGVSYDLPTAADTMRRMNWRP